MRAVREADPGYSVKKIRPILLRSMKTSEVPSAAARRRLIARENLFFRPDTNRHKKHAKSAKTAHERTGKPYDLKADGARQIIGFGMKHVCLLGQKICAFAL